MIKSNNEIKLRFSQIQLDGQRWHLIHQGDSDLFPSPVELDHYPGMRRSHLLV
ncbi:hypothetical protein H6G36_30150 [Anabaena minutissima FACHB-250]|nr:hypothetical protein [Anabaena minutissima FACHB-250]